MAQFNLTAQIQLQSPKNVNAVVNDIRSKLKPISADVKVVSNTKDIAAANKQLQNLSKGAKSSQRSVDDLNKTLRESARRFSVITLATGTFLGFVSGFKKSVKAAIEFERELVRISQITGDTTNNLKGLSEEVSRLGTTLGASSSELLTTAKILAQAGFNAEQTRKSLDILAKTTLGASFDDITETTEGAIAVLRQFGEEAARSGGDVKFLEQTLDAINSVSKSFAVESSDLISVIRRTGGVFSAAGGSVNELIALFTSVRATTRESAETIATGLRTIFTRIQRTDTIDQLKQIGINLRDAEGNFVGAFEAVKRLSEGLSAVDPRSETFSRITEELGGFRQVGKVIPLVQQFAVAQEALNVAQGASGSVAKDAEIAQESLGVKIDKVREKFDELIRKFTASETFSSIANGAIKLAEAFIKIADSLEPLLPLLTSLVFLKLGKSIAPGIASFAGIGGSSGGFGPVSRFATGGLVPGSGNRDTVPAMLTPGEFVIKKSSVAKLGAGTLAQMNSNGYAAGGVVHESRGFYGDLDPSGRAIQGKARGLTLQEAVDAGFKRSVLSSQWRAEDVSSAIELSEKSKSPTIKANTPLVATLKNSEVVGGLFLQQGKGGTKGISKEIEKGSELLPSGKFKNVRVVKGNISTGLLKRQPAESLRASIGPAVEMAVQTASANTIKGLEIDPFDIDEKMAAKEASSKIDLSSIEGFIFEAFISSLSGLKLAEVGDTFDFPKTTPATLKRLENFFETPVKGKLIDAKRTLNSETIQSGRSSIANKTLAAIKKGQLEESDFNFSPLARQEKLPGFASGGGVSGSDTVPAMLTPGEFVINKGAAQKIGYGNLNRMNKQGVAKFAKGGPVGIQKFAGGGGVDRDFNLIARGVDPSTILELLKGGVNDTLENLGYFGTSLDDTAKSAENESDAREKSKNSIEKEDDARNKQLTSLQKFGQGVEKVQKIAQSAQNFVFLTSAVTSLTAEMSSLSDTTKVAVERTSTFVAGVVGIGGTLIDTFASVILSMKLFNAGVAAQSAVGAAGAVGAGAAKGAGAIAGVAAGFSSLLGPLALVAVAIGGVVIAFKYFQEKYRAETEALINATKKLRESFEETGNGSREYADSIINAANRIDKAAGIGTEGYRGGRTASRGTGGGLIVDEDTKPSSFIGGSRGRSRRGARVEPANFKDLNKTISESVKNFADLKKQILDQKQAFEQLQSNTKLTEEQRAKEFSDIAGQDIDIQGAIDKAFENIKIATDVPAFKQAVGSGKIKSIEDATNLSADTPKGAANSIAILRESLATLELASKAASEQIKINAQEIQNIEIGFTESQAISEGGIEKAPEELKSALDRVKKNIDLQSEAERGRVEKLRDAGLLEEANAKQRIEEINENAAKQKEAQDKIITSQANYVVEFNKNNQEAIKLQNQYALGLQRIIDYQSDFIKQANDFSNIASQIDRVSTARSGGVVAGEAAKLQETDIQNILDPKTFASQLISISSQARERGVDDRTIITIESFQTNLLSASKAISTLREKALSTPDLTKEAAKKLVENLPGADPNTQKIIAESLAEAFVSAGDKLTPDAFNQAIKPYTDTLSSQLGAIEALSSANQQYLNAYQAYLNQVTDLYDFDVQSRTKYLDTFQSTISNSERALALVRKSTGAEAGPSTGATLFAAESERIAQQNLTSAGVDIKTGDLGALEQQRQLLQQTIDDIAKTGPANVKQQQDLAKSQIALKAVNSELERLQSGTVQANALFEQIENNIAVIEKEKRAREQVLGVVQDFVIGGEDARQNLLNASQGIRQAFATGTLQLQSPEQRQATVGLLDRLGDVELAPGLTGKQLKQELVIRDAIAMGLDPEIAKQLATATTVEEKLIERNKELADEVKTLNATMLEANRILAQRQGVQAPGIGQPELVLPQQLAQDANQAQKNQDIINKQQQQQVAADPRLQKEMAELERRKGLLESKFGGREFGEDDRKQLSTLKGLEGMVGLTTEQRKEMNQLEMQRTLTENINRGKKRLGVFGNDIQNLNPNAIQQIQPQQIPANVPANIPVVGGQDVNAVGAAPGSLDNFIAGFSPILDNITKVFSGISNSLDKLAQSFGGFTMQHTVTVEGLINLGGLNIDTIKNELSNSIGQMVAQEVTNRLDDQSKKFSAG